MGTVKLRGIQALLQRVSDALHSGEEVPVRILPEPENPMDRNAVAFQCFVDNIWHKFGYAVREVTDELQTAIANNLIRNAQFKAVRYICRCAPGFYAAVDITKNGVWSQNVVRAKSTF